MRRHRFPLSLCVIACLAFWGTASAHADSGDDAEARQLIQTVVSDAVQAFGDKTLAPAERMSSLAELIDRHGDIAIYSEDALGRYWKRLSPIEQAHFAKLLTQYLQGCWEGPLNNVPPSLRIDFTTSDVLADGRIAVHSLAVVPNDTLAVDWTITRAADGRPIIADVAVDGISVFQTMKSDFLSILRANGGRLDILFNAVQQKIATQQEPR
ncbi:MAG TPA: ABC transporter substrate-binding protein [Telmatospirillum sp.]|nr:ABC transporter substrate-binding protein [Telmatospirillum sp.]